MQKLKKSFTDLRSKKAIENSIKAFEETMNIKVNLLGLHGTDQALQARVEIKDYEDLFLLPVESENTGMDFLGVIQPAKDGFSVFLTGTLKINDMVIGNISATYNRIEDHVIYTVRPKMKVTKAV